MSPLLVGEHSADVAAIVAIVLYSLVFGATAIVGIRNLWRSRR